MTDEAQWRTHHKRSENNELITDEAQMMNSWQTEHNDELMTDEAQRWTHDRRSTMMNSWQTKQKWWNHDIRSTMMNSWHTKHNDELMTVEERNKLAVIIYVVFLTIYMRYLPCSSDKDFSIHYVRLFKYRGGCTIPLFQLGRMYNTGTVVSIKCMMWKVCRSPTL